MVGQKCNFPQASAAASCYCSTEWTLDRCPPHTMQCCSGCSFRSSFRSSQVQPLLLSWPCTRQLLMQGGG